MVTTQQEHKNGGVDLIDVTAFDEVLQRLLPDHGLSIESIRKLRDSWQEDLFLYNPKMAESTAMGFIKPMFREEVRACLAEERKKLGRLEKKTKRLHASIEYYDAFLGEQEKSVSHEY